MTGYDKDKQAALIKDWQDLFKHLDMPKSPILQAMVQHTTTSKSYGGVTPSHYVIDSCSTFDWNEALGKVRVGPDPDLIIEYRAPGYAAADVVVMRRRLEKRDPRNPNPAAGPVTGYAVIAGGRESGFLTNSVTATLKAKTLHERLLKGLVEAEQAEIERLRQQAPNYGRF